MGNVLHSSKLLTFVVTALVYFTMFNPFTKYPPQTIGTAIFKMLPIWSLAVYVIPQNTGLSDLSNRQQNILMGLLVSSAGDFCLVWKETLFVPGLLIFGVAHAFYLRAFGIRFAGSKSDKDFTSRSFPMYAVVTFGACFYVHQSVPTPTMQCLVMCYSVLLFLMSWRATVCFEYTRTTESLAGCLGTACFLLSDSIIGLNKWVTPVPCAEGLVMVTYYLAQLGIAMSACSS